MQLEENKTVETPKENVTTTENSTQQQPEETVEQINWRKFRKEREEERKIRQEAERKAQEKEKEAAALKAAMEALLEKPVKPARQEEIEDLSEDEKIQRKIDAALAQKEKIYEEERKRREQQEFPQRLIKTFNDFEQVCSTENLDYLEYHYPEVAEGFKYMPDGFDKWSAVYKAVKRFIPNPNDAKDKKKAESNLNRPQSMSLTGKSASGDQTPSMLDDQRKKQNWARMQKAMKSLG